VGGNKRPRIEAGRNNREKRQKARDCVEPSARLSTSEVGLRGVGVQSVKWMGMRPPGGPSCLSKVSKLGQKLLRSKSRL
jgi:hypothetical protein